MQTYKDGYGLEWTAHDGDQLAGLTLATTSYLGSYPDTLDIVAGLVEPGQSMPMALCLQAYLIKMSGDPRLRPTLMETQARLQQDFKHLNDRELRHLRALELWTQDYFAEATVAFEALLADYPLDMIALRMAHYLHFYAGDGRALRDSIKRVFEAWPESSPWFGFLEGMYAFGLEEAHDYVEAEIHGLNALALNPADIWAAHAVVHTHYMTGRPDEGLDLINRYGDWADHSNFRFHLVWHKALMHLRKDDPAKALDIFDEALLAAISDDFYLDTCNASALLLRLHMRGVDVGTRWQHLGGICERRATDDELVFATLHYLIAPAMVQDRPTLERGLAAIEHWATRKDTQGDVSRDVGVAVAQSIASLADDDRPRIRQLLEPAIPALYRIGGSNAQRELFEELLLYAQGD